MRHNTVTILKNIIANLFIGWLAVNICRIAPATEVSSVTDTCSSNPFEFQLDQPVPNDLGGLFVHDLNNDGLMDFVVTSKNHIGAYDHSGKKLWVRAVPIKLFGYLHHPSALAGDIDNDGKQEIGYLTPGKIIIVNGATGIQERALPCYENVEAIAIANLRGKGEADAILQFSQTKIKAISLADGSQLWQTDEFKGIEHSPVRLADLDKDGLDEIAGANIIDENGNKINSWDLGDVYRSMDSIVIADIVPGLPLEVALAEQRGSNSHTDVVNADTIIFRSLNPWNWEDPDKLAVGDFDAGRPGLEIFNRSSGGDGTGPRSKAEPYANEECPWVLDSKGALISKYYINDQKPSWWTGRGLEEICRIDWDGDAEEEIVGKERHTNGAGAVVNPITGEFKKVFPGRFVRIYAADIRGDYREEVIAIDQNGSIRVFCNNAPNTNPQKPRYWEQQHYRRQKQNWNYYSP